MKMFLTRMGFGSKVVVTGDITQVDLPGGKKSGLVEAEKILKNVKGIDFCHLNEMDVVRHEMVSLKFRYSLYLTISYATRRQIGRASCRERV